MNKQLIILNSSSQFINKELNNKIIIEINKLDISKDMKKILFIAALNLLSLEKTTKSLIYQLENFKSQNNIFHQRTQSKYVNDIIKYIKNMPNEELHNNIDYLINYLKSNNISFKIKN